MKLAKAMSMALACAMAATMCATSAFAATSGSTKVNATVTPDTGPAQQRSAVRKRINNFLGKEENVCA